MDPRLELVVLEPPDVVALGLTGTPNELTVNEAERLKKEKIIFEVGNVASLCQLVIFISVSKRIL